MTTKLKQINREQYEALVAIGAPARASYVLPIIVLGDWGGYKADYLKWPDQEPYPNIQGLYYYTLVEADGDV